MTSASVAVECVARRKEGSASAARTSPRLVSMPSTRVLASASSRRSSACARSEPYAMTFASIGSYDVVTSVPVSTQPSTRTPPGNSTRVSRPALGRWSREGSSAYTRASTA